MNRCKVCNKECNGNTCSGACRAKLSRRTRTADLGAQTRRTQTSARATKEPDFNGFPINPPTMSDHIENVMCPPVTTRNRTNPDTLNYGPAMSKAGLVKAGLRANNVPIPGDSDYGGVCVEVAGVWQVGQGVT